MNFNTILALRVTFCAQMSTFTELVILKEEERVLMKIASKLNDQLNRLKVSIIRHSCVCLILLFFTFSALTLLV